MHVDIASRSARWGVINTVGLGLLFGWTTAGLLLVLAAMLYSGLRFATRRGENVSRATAGWLLTATLAALFAAYKLGFERTESMSAPIALAWNVLRAASFSYVFLRAIDLVRSVAFGRTRLLDPLALAGYLGPAHMLLSGPITPYAEHVDADAQPLAPPTFARLIIGVQMIVTGLFMKVVIAQSLKVFLYGVKDPITVESWWDTAYLMVYLYFDFGGYSLMALGIGRLVAVPTPRNFNRPFLAPSVTEFWTRWHMSLNIFVRNNLFLPMHLFVARVVARRVRNRTWSTVSGLVPLAASFMFVAAWHRLSVTFGLWGVSMAMVIVIEKLVRDRLAGATGPAPRMLRGAWRFVGPIYTMAVIITGIHFVAKEIFV